jgi:hypothetical protein
VLQRQQVLEFFLSNPIALCCVLQFNFQTVAAVDMSSNCFVECCSTHTVLHAASYEAAVLSGTALLWTCEVLCLTVHV